MSYCQSVPELLLLPELLLPELLLPFFLPELLLPRLLLPRPLLPELLLSGFLPPELLYTSASPGSWLLKFFPERLRSQGSPLVYLRGLGIRV